MKINFSHPLTKKPSSVVFRDIWLKPWFRATSSGSSDLPAFVSLLAGDFYVDHADACKLVGFVPVTFTQYCEAVLAISVDHALNLALAAADSHQSGLIPTLSRQKAFSRSENKIRARPVCPEQSLGSDL
jgi:hypothetical protein